MRAAAEPEDAAMTNAEREQLLAWAERLHWAGCNEKGHAVIREMRAAAEPEDAPRDPAYLSPLIMPVHIAPVAGDLTCLICQKPSFDPRRDSTPRCEYVVTYRSPYATMMAGLHKNCYERAYQPYQPASTPESSTTLGKAALGVSPVAPTSAGEGSEEPALSWRVGRKLGRTLYREDLCVGMVDTPELAADIVKRMNESQGD
jgi:hypothetical protein